MKRQSQAAEKLTTLIDQEKIAQRVCELGEEITRDYSDKLPLKIIAPLRGSVVFLTDLIRCIDLPLSIDFLEVSSYGNQMQSTGNVKIVKDLRDDIADEHVIIVEDIIDTGLTLNTLMEMLKTRRPASLEISSLLVKPDKHDLAYPIRYSGFHIEDKFVIGYGLDYKGRLRNLPYIAAVENAEDLKEWD